MPMRAANIGYFWLNILWITIAASTVPYLLKTDIVTSAILSDLWPRKQKQKASVHTPNLDRSMISSLLMDNILLDNILTNVRTFAHFLQVSNFYVMSVIPL